MILSGRYLGEIIDAFGTIAERAELRAKIGFTDLHRVLEDFFMNILNELDNLSLTNTNREAANSAGIDLYDANSKIGIQITTVSSSDKINNTLRVVHEQNNTLKSSNVEALYVLIIGKKQGSYKLDSTLCEALDFNEKDNIWDIVTLSRKLIGIKPDVLESIYKFVMRELTRVRIELELPDSNGEFPTDLGQYMEVSPSNELGECKKLKEFCTANGWDNGFEEAISELRLYFQKLSSLPRITRQVLGEIIDNREPNQSKIYVIWEKFRRICTYPELDTEFNILVYDNYLTRNIHEEERIITVHVKGDGDRILGYLEPFLQRESKTFNKLFSTFDFSIFENP